jgi:hypothetical protein
MSSVGDDSLVDVGEADRPLALAAPFAHRNFGNTGWLKSPKPNDHQCLIYDDRGEFISEAIEFLRAGLGLNQRLIYIGDAEPPELARPDAGVIADAQLAKCEQRFLHGRTTGVGTLRLFGACC